MANWGGRRREKLANVLSRVPLEPPWTVGEFLTWLEEDSGRAVELSPWTGSPLEPENRCGLLLGGPDRYVIRYDSTRSVRHQRQQIFHEVGHVLCQHPGERFKPTAGVLTDGLSLAGIEYMMQRSTFDSPTEAEAELVGTQLAVLSRGPIDLDSRGEVHRIALTFDKR
ncbi:ImmA/IrrE family metallo-endopeptidase [Rhodococcus sp. NPDC003318]|uniref:ImmA/IrrE family metallo-endopeptidase n=1 Tax=Rhodococcus sp. NPDC003318 TaxID=3364503 RepID=UPI0036BD9FA4